MIESAPTLANPIPTNPMAIHRFNTFLGMTALSNRSAVSFLSRGVTQKRRLYLNGERVYGSTQKARAKRSSKARNSESSRQAHCDHQQRGASGRLHHRVGLRTPCLMPHPSINATLANLDLNGFRLCLHRFREMHPKHPVVKVRGHLTPIRILRK
jgi:hypothetical protein